MKASEIKVGRFYTDGQTVRMVRAKSGGAIVWLNLTTNSPGMSHTRSFAESVTCEVKPVWVLMELCDQCESDDVAFSYQGRSYCLACGKKQPEGTGMVTNK